MKKFSTFRYLSIATLVLLVSGSAFAQNVGIGQAAPKSKLDVNGNLQVGATYSGVTANAAPANGAIIEGKVGIGTAATTVAQSLQIGNAATGTLETVRIVDLATGGDGDFGQASGAKVQTNSSAGKAVYTDASGNLTARYIYGDNIVSTKLPAGTQNIVSGGTGTNITNGTLTLASPRHTTTFLSFSISGYNPLTGTAGTHSSWVAIDVFQDGVKIGSFLGLAASSSGGSTGAATVTIANFPVTTVIGTSTTILLKARASGGGTGNKDFTIDNTNYTSYMTILD
jgi:hypothetical protein